MAGRPPASVNDIAFDDWIEFVRWAQPCQANSGDWENLGSVWQSIEDPAGTTLYVPLSRQPPTRIIAVTPSEGVAPRAEPPGVEQQ